VPLSARSTDGIRGESIRRTIAALRQWRKLIFVSGAADRRLYETAMLATLRERLRGSDIWVAGNRDYRAFEDYCCLLGRARHRHPR
jgi:hypothetical protein